jgi:hypothetical protein
MELKRITDGYKVVLHDANKILAKYDTLRQDGNARAAKKLWEQFLFGTTIKDHPAIRGKLLTWTADLSVFLQQMQLQDIGEVKAISSRVEASLEASTSRVITELAELKRNIRRSQDPNASVSPLSTYAGNDKEVWLDIFRDSRRDAVRLGYTSKNLKEHRNDLQGHLLGFFQQHTQSRSRLKRLSMRLNIKARYLGATIQQLGQLTCRDMTTRQLRQMVESARRNAGEGTKDDKLESRRISWRNPHH